jgi:protein-S-isoprenylcysteine O-methyltransferase Ste14
MSMEEKKGHHHGRHAGREDLTGEHRFGDMIQLIFLVIFMVLWILDSFILKFSTFSTGSIPGFIRWPVGIILLVFAFYLAQSGMKAVFGKTQEIPHVITRGVFSIVRHPIYLGAILAYGVLTSLTMSVASAALLMLIIAFYWYISRYEENLLIERFGDEYRDYRKKVPMLFPLKMSR